MNGKDRADSWPVSDVDHLLQEIDMPQLDYQEVAASQRLDSIRQRWPLLDEMLNNSKLNADNGDKA